MVSSYLHPIVSHSRNIYWLIHYRIVFLSISEFINLEQIRPIFQWSNCSSRSIWRLKIKTVKTFSVNSNYFVDNDECCQPNWIWELAALCASNLKIVQTKFMGEFTNWNSKLIEVFFSHRPFIWRKFLHVGCEFILHWNLFGSYSMIILLFNVYF